MVSPQPGLLRSRCRPRWVWQTPKRKRCPWQAKSTLGRYSLRKWRRRQKHERRISLGEQQGPRTLYVARVWENGECGRGEREAIHSSMFSAGHEPPQDGDVVEESEFTQCSAFGVGHEPTQASALGEGRKSTLTDPWDRRGGSAWPAGP